MQENSGPTATTCQDTQTKSILKTPRQCSETGDPKFPICRALRRSGGDASRDLPAACFANGAEGESCSFASGKNRLRIDLERISCACRKEFLIKHSLWNVWPPICQTGAGLAGKCHLKTAIESIHESKLGLTLRLKMVVFGDGSEHGGSPNQTGECRHEVVK